jgi:hypothetical protein
VTSNYYYYHTFEDNRSNNENEDYDSVDLFGLSITENSSNQCTTSLDQICCLAYCSSDDYDAAHHHHQDKPLWWLVLRWIKMMVLKIARSYHAKPLLLVILPLAIGLLIGFWLGRRPQQQQQQQQQQQTKAKNTTKTIYNTLTNWISMFGYHILVQKWKLFPVICDTPVAPRKGKTDKTLQRQVDDAGLEQREESVRTSLRSDKGSSRDSGVPISQVPKHVAVIMDGNRRYGNAKYGNVSQGHWDGSSKLVEFAKWCVAEKVKVLTVFAFSSENWNRDPAEVASLMQIFATYCDELRVEAIQRNIKILVLSTDHDKVRDSTFCVTLQIFKTYRLRHTLT